MSRNDFAKYCQDRQFYLFYRKGTDGRVWEELSQAVRIRVSGRLGKNREGSSPML